MEMAKAEVKTIQGSTTVEELFGIMESAIKVAASKYPQEFSTQKSKLVDLLSKKSAMTTNDMSTHPIKNVEEPAEKKRMIVKLKINGGVLSKGCDHKEGMESAKVCPTMVTQEPMKKRKESEICSKSLKFEGLKRKIEERYGEVKKARKSVVQLMDLCDLPPHHLWSRRMLKKGPEPAQKKKTVIKLKINGGVSNKACDHTQAMESVLSKGCDRKQAMESGKVSQPKIAQEALKNNKKKEMDMKLEASKRKLAQRYMEAKKARKTIKVLESCDLPRQQGFSVGKWVSTKPRTIRRRL